MYNDPEQPKWFNKIMRSKKPKEQPPIAGSANCSAALTSRRSNILKNKLYEAAIELQETRQKLYRAQNTFDELYKKLPRKHK
jgi:hypothetical protein